MVAFNKDIQQIDIRPDTRNLRSRLQFCTQGTETCVPFNIEASKDNTSQTTSPHLGGKPSTKDLKEKENRERLISVKDPRSEGILFEKVYIIV